MGSSCFDGRGEKEADWAVGRKREKAARVKKLQFSVGETNRQEVRADLEPQG